MFKKTENLFLSYKNEDKLFQRYREASRSRRQRSVGYKEIRKH